MTSATGGFMKRNRREPRLRNGNSGTEKKLSFFEKLSFSSFTEPDLPTYVLSIIKNEGDSLRVSFYPKNVTISHYEIQPFDKRAVDKICSELSEELDKANRGFGKKSILKYLKKKGTELSDLLLTETVKDGLKKCKSKHLIISLDDQVVHIPWELLCINRKLLCHSFNVGRTVQTSHLSPPDHDEDIELSKILIIANPTNDLPESETEGEAVKAIAKKYNKDVSVRNDMTVEDIHEIIGDYDIVHFAGHAVYKPYNPAESGWKFSEEDDGILSAEAVHKMKDSEKIDAMPYLVFSNACESAKERWDAPSVATFGLANAFLLSGVNHYIGTLWKVQDEHSSQFAAKFYDNLFSGKSIGESLKLARSESVRGGDVNACWTSYVLYGDPTTEYEERSETIWDKILEIIKNYGNYFLVGLTISAVIYAFMVGYYYTSSYNGRPTVGVEISNAFVPYLSQGKDFFAATVIEKNILKYQCITLVDRLTVEKIIKEQKLRGIPWYNIKPGILPAKYLLYLSVDKSSGEEYVVMRLRESSSKIIDIFHEPLESDKLMLKQQERLVSELSKCLTKLCEEHKKEEK